MADKAHSARFEKVTDIQTDSPTLIEGLPGHGLVAAIAVDQITEQLGLAHYGNIISDSFPPVVTFENGLVHDLVRVYGGNNPPLMTLESDLALPPQSFEPLSKCVIRDLSPEFKRAIFLAGAPAESENQIGQIVGVASDETIRQELIDAGIDIPEEPGLVGGVTGSLVRECYQEDIPTALLIVRAHPFLPDPDAAQSLIDNALEPLVDFDIDTTELSEQAETIRRQMRQIAEQYQQMFEEQQVQDQPLSSMYQ